jgi:TIR domain
MLPELIEKEIGLGHFFVFCNSEASRKSQWVQEEIRIVKAAFPEKVCKEIDLEADLAPQLDELLSLSKRSTVFLSFSQKDKAIAARMRPALEAADFKVFMDVDDLSASYSFVTKMDEIIGLAAQTGYALILLSNAYLTSAWARAELKTAIDKAKLYRRSNVVPVIVEKGMQMPGEIMHLAPFDLTADDFDERVRLLIRELKQREME